MKKVLYIAYHYSPDAAIGAVRTVEFVNHLSELGWEPIILTVKKKYYSKIDENKYRDDKEVHVERVFKFININDVYLKIRNLYKKNIKRNNPLPQLRSDGREKTNIKKSSGILFHLKRYYNSLLVYLIDKENGWIIPGIIKGLKIIRSHKVDVIISTGPPHSTHLISYFLSKLSGTPFVTDFRDPWSTDVKSPSSRCYVSDKIENYFLGKIVKKAKYAISVTPEMTESFKSRYPQFKSKFITINNGYDEKRMVDYIGKQKYKKLTISYLGSLYFGRNPYVFLQAISQLIKEKIIEKNNIIVKLVGDCKISDGVSVEKIISELSLNDSVAFSNFVPHDEALDIISRSHAVLLFAQSQPLQIPGKIYEYIALSSNIIAFCNEGATRNLLKEYPFTYFANPNDVSQTKDSIKKLIARFNTNGLKNDADIVLKKYDRRYLSENLSHVLNNAAKLKTPEKNLQH